MRMRAAFGALAIIALLGAACFVWGIRTTSAANAQHVAANREILARVCVSNKERDAGDASAAIRLLAVIDESRKNAGAPLALFLGKYRAIVTERAQRHRLLSDVDCSKIATTEGLP